MCTSTNNLLAIRASPHDICQAYTLLPALRNSGKASILTLVSLCVLTQVVVTTLLTAFLMHACMHACSYELNAGAAFHDRYTSTEHGRTGFVNLVRCAKRSRLLIDTQLIAVMNFKHSRGSNHDVVLGFTARDASPYGCPASLKLTKDCNWASHVSFIPAQTRFRDA